MKKHILGIPLYTRLGQLFEIKVLCEDVGIISLSLDSFKECKSDENLVNRNLGPEYKCTDVFIKPQMEDYYKESIEPKINNFFSDIYLKYNNQIVYEKLYHEYVSVGRDDDSRCKDFKAIFSPVYELTKKHSKINIFINGDLLSKLVSLNKNFNSHDIFKGLINQLNPDGEKEINLLSKNENGRIFKYIQGNGYDSFEPRVIDNNINIINNEDARLIFIEPRMTEEQHIEFRCVLDKGNSFTICVEQDKEIYKKNIIDTICSHGIQLDEKIKPIIVLDFNDLRTNPANEYTVDLIMNGPLDKFNIIDINSIIIANNYSVSDNMMDIVRKLKGIKEKPNLSSIFKAKLMRYVYYKLM